MQDTALFTIITPLRNLPEALKVTRPGLLMVSVAFITPEELLLASRVMVALKTLNLLVMLVTVALR
jgi:hypothetical protein